MSLQGDVAKLSQALNPPTSVFGNAVAYGGLLSRATRKRSPMTASVK